MWKGSQLSGWDRVPQCEREKKKEERQGFYEQKADDFALPNYCLMFGIFTPSGTEYAR